MLVLYVITAALLLLFGNGYRVQIPGFKILRTGNLLITFVPTRSNVLLDGSLVDTSAPSRVRAVFPGNHTVAIMAPGFFPYSQPITVQPMRTTFVSDVYLLEKHDAVLVSSSTSFTAPAELIAPTSTVVNGSLLSVSSTPAGGTIITNGTNPLTRDLGIGSWRIAGGDGRYFAITRLDASQTQFRLWSSPDSIAFSVPGTHLLDHSWNNINAISVHLVFTPFELWEVNPNSGAATLLSRLSKPIITVLPVPQTAVALAVLPDEIIAYQLADTLNVPISIAHAPEGAEIVSASLNTAGGVITYTTKKGAEYSTWTQVILTR